TVASALAEAATEDTVIISGIVTESVTVTKSVTIRGPSLDELTPGTHMGFVQASRNAPAADCATTIGSVFTIAGNAQVEMRDLNLRNGCAVNGGGVNVAAGSQLHLSGVTIYNSRATNGGALYNSGLLSITNSTAVSVATRTGGSGGGLYNAAGGQSRLTHVTLLPDASYALENHSATAISAASSIIGGPGTLCSGSLANGGYNLIAGAGCDGLMSAATGDPLLGALRDNGGPTLTRAIISPDSPAVLDGADSCAVAADQRGKQRPLNRDGAAGGRCDIGATEFGPQTLTVCANCNADLAALRFADLAKALNRAMAGDTVAIGPGIYTGNFVVYRDLTLRHAGVDVSGLDAAQAIDVRAILQASNSPLLEQRQALTATQSGKLAGRVLTVHAYAPWGDTIVPAEDVTAGIQDLTVRYGMDRAGGAIFNRGQLRLERMTLTANAAVNEYVIGADGSLSVTVAAQGGAIYNAGALTIVRSTLSGNQSESAGGAIFSNSALVNAQFESLEIIASTLVDNKAAPLPRTWTVRMTDSGFQPFTTTVLAGDEIRFDNYQGPPRQLTVQPSGVTCNVAALTVPAMGAGLSAPLVCTGPGSVTVVDSVDAARHETFAVQRYTFTPTANTLYRQAGLTRLERTILLSDGDGDCDKNPAITTIEDGGYNLLDDSSCLGAGVGTVAPAARQYLGDLQDNNQIDFGRGWLSGFVETHALLPNSPAIDQIPVYACVSGVVTHSLGLAANVSIGAGDIVAWQNTTPATVTLALDDGEADVRLLATAPGATSSPFQPLATTHYRAYDSTGVEIGAGVITVSPRLLPTDQRGLTLPLRGVRPTATDPATFDCDIGAYEFQPWVVGQPVPRPPAAVGSLPTWQPATGGDGSSYHAWNTATAQDFALRPGYDESDADNQLPEQITVIWDGDPDVALVQELPLVGLIVWPDAPQVHVAGVPVNLSHSGITDDFLASSAAAFEGTRPAAAEAGALLANGIFTRKLLDLPGASYSVLQFSQNSGNPTLKIAVVQSLDWQTPGIVDRKAPDATGQPCVIGTELGYHFTTAAGATVHHADPEGKAGYILAGAAYDGVPTAGELSVAQNTVDGLLPPAHARDTREGPIIPVLEATPSSTRTLAGHDLEVAWYRTDARNVAWPVKSAGYLCNWPVNPPQIVIASELGSEIGGQPLLDPAHFANATIYHQTVTAQPGYSPNWEHALLSASNLGNLAPALYALRTDLRDRISSTLPFESYALLKYQDPSQQNRIQMSVYRVVVTAPAQPIAPDSLPFRVAGELPANGRVTLPVEVVGARNLANLTVRIPYDPGALTPVSCAVNEQKFVEAPASLTVSSDQNMRPLHVVHLRADLAAGTDVQYQWNLGDGVVRYAGNQVSNVYPNAGNYTVIVTATNGLFAPAVQRNDVAISDSASPVTIGAAPTQTGCRIEGNEVVLQLIARNKHGESGNLTLADITFQATNYAGPLHLAVHPTMLLGPDYSQLRFNMTAGNPVFAPIPMRKLLDVQPCAETEPYQPATAKPFWKDFRDMVWARAAGEMQVLYYYPLQRSFPLPDGTGAVGQCVPWMEHQATGTLSNTQNVRVLPVTYNVTWPPLAPMLTVGETVYERSKNGISGVAEQAAVAKIYDDLAPGRWDNYVEKIVIGGVETIANLAQLIDPLSAVSEEVDILIDGNPSLPAAIKTERLLYGGGMALVGTTDNEITLPFALRSRVLFDDAEGKLIFRGYYDGISPEYIKGDPLLLLNVMSQADRTRLQSLCPTDSVPPYYDDTECGKYNYAVNALYWKSHNPRQVDLCRTATGLIWENGSQANNHDLLMLQNRIADAQRSDRDFSFEDYNAACPAGASRDLQPDWDFLIAVQDADNNGIPEAYEGLGKGKALSAGNAAGTGYVTLVYNNDASLGGLPVSLQVIQVGCTLDDTGMESPYRGNLLVIKSDNIFDEKLTLRHTGDFGGRPENFTFDWYIAPVDDTAVSPTAAPPAYPWQAWTKVEPGMSAVDAEITIEGANPTTLADNWLIMRYMGSPACGNAYRYSAWAGDPSAKPSEVRAQLAEGWIK
ncbi:MAG: PKD domain-containing protein, partial [Caldilineaceae bacterium]|nr:PKD domain-containing protein [Caldilineaceae bacterium]